VFAVSALAPAAPPKKTAKKKTPVKTVVAKKKIGAENGLVGIHLYDSGLTVLKKYGNPIDIQGVSIGGQSAGPGSGFGGPAGGPLGPLGPMGPMGPMGPGGMRGGPGPMGPSGGPGGGIAPALDELKLDPESVLYAPPGSGGPAGGTGSGGGAPRGGLQPPPGFGGPGGMGAPPGMMGPGGMGAPPGMMGPGGMPGGMGAPGGLGAPGGSMMGSGFSGRTVFTRWVYHRPESRYAFILDKFNRVVQIEAIGLKDSKVRTARGIGFGAQFKQIITAYGAPDAYEISGNSLVIRYLVRHKVAFRLNRLGENQPHVVTGIVVAAGKA